MVVITFAFRYQPIRNYKNKLLQPTLLFVLGLAVTQISGCESILGYRIGQNESGVTIERITNSPIAIPLKFDAANEFSQRLTAVKINGKWGYIAVLI